MRRSKCITKIALSITLCAIAALYLHFVRNPTALAQENMYNSAEDYCYATNDSSCDLGSLEQDSFLEKLNCLFSPVINTYNPAFGTNKWWNENSSPKCQTLSEQVITGKEKCVHLFNGLVSGTHQEYWLYQFDANNRHPVFLGVNNKCDVLSEGSHDRTVCSEISSLFQECKREYVDARTTELETETVSPPEDTVGELKLSDFEEMSFYAKYIRTVLISCRKLDGKHCNRELLNSTATKARLETIIGLTIYGSVGYSQSGAPEDLRISDLPGVSVERGEEKLGETASCVPFSEVNQIGIKFNMFYENDSYYDNQAQLRIGCRPTATTLAGATKNLLKYCQSNQKTDCEACDKTLLEAGGVPGGLLSSYKTRPMFLQTMYWNSIDNTKDGRKFTWVKVSASERQQMIDVLKNPDQSSEKICSTENSEESEAPESQNLPCDFEGGLGWLLCGGSDFLMRSYDSAYGELEKWMTIKPSILNPSLAKTSEVDEQGNNVETDAVVFTENPVQLIWQTMMGIANILVVLAVLIVILSQVTGYGLSNYSIKKMLPKIAVAVILINLSFFALQLLVAISNLVGKGVYELVVSAAKVESINTVSVVDLHRLSTDSTNLLTVITFILGVLFWLVTMVLQLLILSGRDAILIIVAVTAPIIAIAYFLPNTKKITSMWGKGLMFALALYPMTALIYAMGRLGYQLSITGAKDFVSGLISHTTLILPMIFTPYLAIKLGKSMPVIAAGISKLTNYAQQRASGTHKPKEGSRRWYKQKRLADIDDQVKAGQYSGFRPIRATKNAFYRKFGSSKVLAGSTIQLQNKLAKKHDERAELLTTQDAGNIINHYQAIEDAIATNQSAPVANLVASSTGMATLMASKGGHKDIIIEAGLAQIKNSMATNSAINVQTFAQSLSLARANGASQEELQAAHRQALSYFKGSNDFSATGELKALASYYADHPNSEGETWGNYDPSAYTNTTDSNGNDTEFTTYRKKAIRSDMIHQVLEQPFDEDGAQKSIEAHLMPDGSIAREVFTNEYNNSQVFEAQIRQQAGNFSDETYRSIDSSLNQGLSYDAFSANLTPDLVNNINSAKYSLGQADQINLSRLLRQAGVANYDAESIRLSHNLPELRQMVNGIRLLSSTERDNIIGFSLKDRVPVYNAPAPKLQQRVDKSYGARSKNKRQQAKNTNRKSQNITKNNPPRR